MKRLILIAVLAAALAALLAGTALAAGPVTPPTQGFGQGMGMRGMGMHAPGTGMGTEMVPGGMMRRGAPAWAGQPEEVEKLLGMTDEQIHTERLAGKSLVQIAAAKGISENTLISTILDAKKADMAALVAAGKLTQAQMDLMVEHMQTQVKIMVERTSVGPASGQEHPCMGGGQGRSGMGQGFRSGRSTSGASF